jgi:hypothetical protein
MRQDWKELEEQPQISRRLTPKEPERNSFQAQTAQITSKSKPTNGLFARVSTLIPGLRRSNRVVPVSVPQETIVHVVNMYDYKNSKLSKVRNSQDILLDRSFNDDDAYTECCLRPMSYPYQIKFGSNKSQAFYDTMLNRFYQTYGNTGGQKVFIKNRLIYDVKGLVYKSSCLFGNRTNSPVTQSFFVTVTDSQQKLLVEFNNLICEVTIKPRAAQDADAIARHEAYQDGRNAWDGGRKTIPCTSTGKSVKLIMHGKKVTRVVHLNKRGTKVVKDNGVWVPLSKHKRA